MRDSATLNFHSSFSRHAGVMYASFLAFCIPSFISASGARQQPENNDPAGGCTNTLTEWNFSERRLPPQINVQRAFAHFSPVLLLLATALLFNGRNN